MKYGFDIFVYAKNIIPYFLRKKGTGGFWTAPNGDFWMLPGGNFWSSGDGNSRHLDWIKSILKPLQSNNDTFDQYTKDTLYQVNLTGQVIYLEHYLNDLFDSQQRRIYISDGSLVFPVYLYNKVDGADKLYLYNKVDGAGTWYLYNKQDYRGQVKFIIHLPSELQLSNYLENQIRAAVNRYKQAGSIYSIVND